MLFFKWKNAKRFRRAATQAIHITMIQTWRTRMKKLIDETPGLTMKALSLKAGLNPSSVHSILAKGHTPSVDNFLAIANGSVRKFELY